MAEKTKAVYKYMIKKQQNFPNNKTKQKLSPADIRKKRAANYQFQ